MKERPILFSAPMVRAILDGRKTQTRRIVNKPIPSGHKFHGWIVESTDKKRDGCAAWGIGDDALAYDLIVAKCKYGKPGDRLWVRETFAHDFEHNRYFYKAECDDDGTVPHLINGCGLGGGVGNTQISKWKPSIHMPRSASRILLEVTNARVERLQDISEKDAIAEGISKVPFRPCDGWPICDGYMVGKDDGVTGLQASAYKAYKKLWESINGTESWDLNPWVWVIDFKVLEIKK